MMKPFILIALSLLFLTGCGKNGFLNDLLGREVVKMEMDTSRFRANCELDIGRFSLILHENIESDIRCLGANLNIFIDLVENEKPGHMSRKAFEAYLRNYRSEDITPDMINALKAIYDINYLLTGDDPEYISKQSVDKIITFARLFNREATKYFRPVFQSEGEVSFRMHALQKEQVGRSAQRIMIALNNVFNANGAGERKLNIMSLLNSFSTDQTRGSIAKIEEALFVKKVLIGGDKEIINHHEISRLLRTFPSLIIMGLDFVRYRYIDLTQADILFLLKSNIFNINTTVFQSDLGDRTHETFFTLDEALNLVKMFISSDTFPVSKYKELIVQAKKILLGGSATEVKGQDFKNLIGHSHKILDTGEVFHRMYKTFLIPLESKLGPLIINFEQNQDIFINHKEEFRKFIRIVKEYRFMKGHFESAYYAREWWRNPEAIFEIYLFEYLIEKVYQYVDPDETDPEKAAWGVKGSTSKLFTHHITTSKLKNLLEKFEDILVELDLISPGRAAGTADTVSLLGTLFQYQSNQEKTPVLDVNETTEFAVSLISSMIMSQELHKRLKDHCRTDGKDRLEASCFRENFLQTFCQEYRRQYPLLFESLGARSCEDIVLNEPTKAYLDVSIKAARGSCYYVDAQGTSTGEEVHFAKGDIMTILTAMMHIDATVIRWDKNKRNNIMDPDEVNLAYEIYSTALDSFLDGKPAIIKKFKKEIYLYLLKYEQVPSEKDFKSIVRFVKFLLTFNKNVYANRKTIAAVLYTISEENAKIRQDAGEPKGTCDEKITGGPAPENMQLHSVEKKADYSYLLNLVDVQESVSGERKYGLKAGACAVFGLCF